MIVKSCKLKLLTNEEFDYKHALYSTGCNVGWF